MNNAEDKIAYGQFSPYPFRVHFDIGIKLTGRGSTRVNLVANNSVKNKY
jgi:hypothetical protein